MISEEVGAAQLTDYTAQITDLFGVPGSRILSDSREHLICEARFVLYGALALSGYSVAAISRACGRNHATVVHALARAAGRPESVRWARYVAYGELAPAAPLMFAHFGDGAGPAAWAYARGLVAGRPLGATEVYGLRAIARSPALQGVVSEALRRRGHERHLWRIRLHARQLGAEWANGPAEQNLDSA